MKIVFFSFDWNTYVNSKEKKIGIIINNALLLIVISKKCVKKLLAN